MSVLYAESWMGITELSESLAPRRKMKSSFFPFNPIVPSANARFMMSGMSVSVASATPRPILTDRPRKARRVRMLKVSILLFLKTLQRQQHRHRPPHASLLRRGIARGGQPYQR